MGFVLVASPFPSGNSFCLLLQFLVVVAFNVLKFRNGVRIL